MQARKLNDEISSMINNLRIADPKEFDRVRDLLVWLMLEEYFELYEVNNSVELHDYRAEIVKRIQACGRDEWRNQFKAMIKRQFEGENSENDENIFREQCLTIFKALVDRHIECRMPMLGVGDAESRNQHANNLYLISIVQHLRFSLVMAQLGSALWIGKLRKFAFDAEAQDTEIKNHPLFNHCLRYDFISQPYGSLSWKDFDDLLNEVITPVDPASFSIPEKINEIITMQKQLLEKYEAIAKPAKDAREEKERRKAIPSDSQGSVSRVPSKTENTAKLSHATDACVPELADQMVVRLKHYCKGLEPRFQTLANCENLYRMINKYEAPKPTFAQLFKKYPDGNDSDTNPLMNQSTMNWKPILKGVMVGLLAALAVVGVGAIIYLSAGAVLPALAAVLVHTVGVIGFSGAIGVVTGMSGVGALMGGVAGWVFQRRAGGKRVEEPGVELQSVVGERGDSNVLSTKNIFSKSTPPRPSPNAKSAFKEGQPNNTPPQRTQSPEGTFKESQSNNTPPQRAQSPEGTAAKKESQQVVGTPPEATSSESLTATPLPSLSLRLGQ